jgi:hypothetical protein
VRPTKKKASPIFVVAAFGLSAAGSVFLSFSSVRFLVWFVSFVRARSFSGPAADPMPAWIFWHILFTTQVTTRHIFLNWSKIEKGKKSEVEVVKFYVQGWVGRRYQLREGGIEYTLRRGKYQNKIRVGQEQQ